MYKKRGTRWRVPLGLRSRDSLEKLRATHAVSAVVAEVAISITDRD